MENRGTTIAACGRSSPGTVMRSLQTSTAGLPILVSDRPGSRPFSLPAPGARGYVARPSVRGTTSIHRSSGEAMLNDSKVEANIPAADLQRARTFYADKLGLTPVQDMGGVS